MQSSSAALLTAVVVGIVLFALGYFWGGFQKARGGLRATKAAVPAARKGYWSSMWLMIKWGFGALLVAGVLLTWVVNDVSDAAQPAPSPAPSRSAPRR